MRITDVNKFKNAQNYPWHSANAQHGVADVSNYFPSFPQYRFRALCQSSPGSLRKPCPRWKHRPVNQNSGSQTGGHQQHQLEGLKWIAGPLAHRFIFRRSRLGHPCSGMGNHTLRTTEFECLAGSITHSVSYLLFAFLPGLLYHLCHHPRAREGPGAEARLWGPSNSSLSQVHGTGVAQRIFSF